MNEDRNQETTEVRRTDETQGATNISRTEVESSSRPSGAVISKRIVYYVAGFIIALLALRMVLLLLAANQGAPFVDLIYAVSSMFAWPFFGIFSYQPAYGQSVFEVSSLVAIIVYALAAMGLGKLFTLTSSRSDT